ncbi:MAG: hypothetical protein ACNA8W_19365 [Bradymonadaceae bacterium]
MSDKLPTTSDALTDFLDLIQTHPDWIKARDASVPLTFAERATVQSSWARAFASLQEMAELAHRESSKPGDEPNEEKPCWETIAYFGARILNGVSDSPRLRIMLNERVPGLLDKPLTLNRLVKLTLHARRRRAMSKMKAGGKSEVVRQELERMSKRVSFLHLFVLAPTLLMLADLYHFLAKFFVSKGWYLYSKIINFYWRFPITLEQQALLRSHLQPGDLLVRRREVITTLFIPGYWTHMILYLGPYEDGVRFFGTEEVNARMRTFGYPSFEACITALYPEAVAAWKGPNFIDGSENIALEATANGVVLNSQRQALTANSIGALRMKLSRADLAMGIIDALSTVGRDFNYRFSFECYENLVCTQVVATAFAPGRAIDGEKAGVYFEKAIIRTLGLRKHGIAPNDFVRQYIRETEQGEAQFEYVFFLEGIKKKHETIVGEEDSFRTTPDW